jgi:hypothetical protein
MAADGTLIIAKVLGEVLVLMGMVCTLPSVGRRGLAAACPTRQDAENIVYLPGPANAAIAVRGFREFR